MNPPVPGDAGGVPPGGGPFIHEPLDTMRGYPQRDEPRRRHRARYALLAASAAVTGAVVAVAMVTASATAGHDGTAAVPRPTAAAVRGPSAMDAWCDGAGDAALRAVQADLPQVTAAATAGNVAAVEAGGGQLAAAAESAGKLPPPVTPAREADYVLAMGAVSLAGTDMASGNIAAASTALETADVYLNDDAGVLSC